MNNILTKADPMLTEVNEDLGKKATQIYLFLWDLAVRDVEYDPRKDLPRNIRRDCGGTTYVSIRGISNYLTMSHNTVRKHLHSLLDLGYIQVSGVTKVKGYDRVVWRVTQQTMLERVRHSISVMGDLPSERLRKIRLQSKRVSFNTCFSDAESLSELLK